MKNHLKVNFLDSAKTDVKETLRDVARKFGKEAEKKLNEDLQKAVKTISEFPLSGKAVEELEEVGSTNFKQWIVGKNRLIYQVREDAVYIYIFKNTRMDLQTLLNQRLLSKD